MYKLQNTPKLQGISEALLSLYTMHVQEVSNCSNIYLRVKQVSFRLNSLFLIMVGSLPGILLSYWYTLLRILQILRWPEFPMYLTYLHGTPSDQRST